MTDQPTNPEVHLDDVAREQCLGTGHHMKYS